MPRWKLTKGEYSEARLLAAVFPEVWVSSWLDPQLSKVCPCALSPGLWHWVIEGLSDSRASSTAHRSSDLPEALLWRPAFCRTEALKSLSIKTLYSFPSVITATSPQTLFTS